MRSCFLTCQDAGRSACLRPADRPAPAKSRSRRAFGPPEPLKPALPGPDLHRYRRERSAAANGVTGVARYDPRLRSSVSFSYASWRACSIERYGCLLRSYSARRCAFAASPRQAVSNGSWRGRLIPLEVGVLRRRRRKRSSMSNTATRTPAMVMTWVSMRRNIPGRPWLARDFLHGSARRFPCRVPPASGVPPVSLRSGRPCCGDAPERRDRCHRCIASYPHGVALVGGPE